MKALIYSRTLPLLTAVCVLSLPCATGAQRLSTNPPPVEVTYGGVTNGIRGGITVRRVGGQNGATTVSVLVTNSNPGELIQEKDYGTNWLKPFLEKMSDNDWLYYMATNSFCGPIELRDSKGTKVLLLKPEVSQPGAYPARYSLSTENANYFRRHQAYRGPGLFPLPLLTVRSCSEVVKLDLAQYFDLKEPGQFQFTVWPKIYKRVAKTNDHCERIDVPPVTVTVKWP